MSKESASAEPSMDQYNELKDKLTKLILHKQDLEAKLDALETSIYDKENEYFNESTHGNIVKGFENFSKMSTGGSSGKRKIYYSDDDHIFSLSSASFVKNLMKRTGQSNKEDFDDYEDTVDPANSAKNSEPPSTAGTPGRKRKARVIED